MGATYCRFTWDQYQLTLKWPRYFYSRWCPRGVPWNPPEKTTFPPEFCNEICTIYVRAIKKSQFCKKKKKKKNVVLFQNGGHITDFYFASFRFWPNLEKTVSQRNFSMKFGSKKENMNRFTLLNKIVKNYSLSKWWPKQFFDIVQ